ncbi:hypothetical protein Hanom_Chr04g00369451 [Helianthus anomalus]
MIEQVNKKSRTRNLELEVSKSNSRTSKQASTVAFPPAPCVFFCFFCLRT